MCVCVCARTCTCACVSTYVCDLCVQKGTEKCYTNHVHELDWRGRGLQRCSMHLDVTAMNNVAGLFGVCNYEYLDNNNKLH